MAREGVSLMAGLDQMAVMGFVEVAARLPFFRRLEREVRALLDSGTIDLVVPIDYPGFNLRMTDRAHSGGIPVVYYIAPQVWAWKAHRAARLARTADRIAVILPFEEEIFRKEGGRVSYVGHPLLDVNPPPPDRETFCTQAGFDPGRPILAVFPGSRAQELRRHWVPFLGAALELKSRHPDLQIGVARASGVEASALSGVRESGARVVEDGRSLLHHARLALVKSGTTTLEAVLEGVPFVVAYRTHPLTFALARRWVRVEYIALANLVAGERVVPEVLQREVSAARLAQELEPLLSDGAPRTRMQEGLARAQQRLGTPGAADRVTDLVMEVLVERGWRLPPGEARREG